MADQIRETLSGTPDGTLVAFTASVAPQQDTLTVYVNMVAVAVLSVSGTTVTLIAAPATGAQVFAIYYPWVTGVTVPTLTALANTALLRIGAKNAIASITDGSANSLKCSASWEFVRDEVLKAKSWRFAKTRALLSASVTAPVYGFQYAYPLPTDYLRLVAAKKSSSQLTNPALLSSGWGNSLSALGSTMNTNYDPPVYPPGFPHIVEALPSGVLCLMSDYDNSGADMAISYIRRVTDLSLYPPGFNSCVLYRWAMELALAVTESLQKMQAMQSLYERSLISEEALNESMDYLEDETGNASWATAGR